MSNHDSSPAQRAEDTAQYESGDRVRLVHTSDPHTRLRPGDLGTVLHVRLGALPAIHIRWDDGSTPAILPDTDDEIALAEPRDRTEV